MITDMTHRIEQDGFMPPISSAETISVGFSPDGAFDRATLLLKDAHGSYFSLYVATEAAVNRMADETDTAEDGGEPEPVLEIQAHELTDDAINDIIYTDPERLRSFVVRQDDDPEASEAATSTAA